MGLSAPALRVVETGELPADGPQTLGDALALIAELQDKVAGYKRTVDRQARDIGGLERRLAIEEDPTQHPRGKEMTSLVERWKRGSGHPRARVSKDRLDLIKARIKDTYDFPELELAVDGLCAFPYVRNGHRVRTGTPHERHDRFGIAMGSGEQVEKFAVLGHQARKAGLVTWGTE